MSILPTPERIGSRLHQHYQEWFAGDGATFEYRLQHTISRIDNVHVYVDGVLQRPDLNGTAHDYKVRGLTPGYSGEQNAIKFAVAPIAAADVLISIVSA